MLSKYFLFPAVIMLGTACGQKTETASIPSDLPEVGDTGKKMTSWVPPVRIDVSDKAPKYTITDSILLTFDQMRLLLPDLAGYKKNGEPSGEGYAKRTSGGITSYVKQEYQKEDQSILLEVIDYRLAQQPLNELMQMFRKNIGHNQPEQITRRLDSALPGAESIATIYPMEKKARLAVCRKNEFLILVSSTGATNVELLASIAKKIRFNKIYLPPSPGS